MALSYLRLIYYFLVRALLILPTFAFIDSPLDWIFAPHHRRGLICPSMHYGCCADLSTWRHGSPCRFPKATLSPEECFKRSEWACCQVKVCTRGRGAPNGFWFTRLMLWKDDTFTCTTGFQHGARGDHVYGWRSGTSEKYFGIGKGEATVEERLALGRASSSS